MEQGLKAVLVKWLGIFKTMHYSSKYQQPGRFSCLVIFSQLAHLEHIFKLFHTQKYTINQSDRQVVLQLKKKKK